MSNTPKIPTGTNMNDLLGVTPEDNRPRVVATVGHLGHTATFTHDQFHVARLLATEES